MCWLASANNTRTVRARAAFRAFRSRSGTAPSNSSGASRGQVVEVLGDEVQRRVGHDLADFALSVAGPAERVHIGIGPNATVLNDLTSEAEPRA
jgi:hypothetical protein